MSNEFMERKEDMSPDGKLWVMVQDDGDIIVSVVPSEENRRLSAISSVEFCAIGAGGGRSPHTRKALADLYLAIKRDNEENPI